MLFAHRVIVILFGSLGKWKIAKYNAILYLSCFYIILYKSIISIVFVVAFGTFREVHIYILLPISSFINMGALACGFTTIFTISYIE